MESAETVMEGSPFDRLVFSLLLAAGILVLISRGSRVAKILRTNGAILFFFAYCLISVLWSDYPDIAFKRWTKAVGDLVMLLIVFTDNDPLGAVKRFLKRPTFVLIPLSILFIKYYPALGTFYGPWGGPRMNAGVTNNKNALGVICLCFGLGALWRFLSAYDDRQDASRKRRMLAYGVILAMVAWLLWIANSVTSISCLFMASILMLATRLNLVRRKPATLHLLIAAMLMVSVSVLFFGVSPDTLASMGRNPTLTDRTEVWGWLFSLVKNPLVGTGFESFWLGPRLAKLWTIYWWHPNEAHNGYIEIYINLGWIGIAVLAVVVVTGYRTVIAAFRQRQPLGNLRLAYFLVGMAYNFTEAAFFKIQAPASLFFLFAIMCVPSMSAPDVRQVVQNRSEGSIRQPGQKKELALTREFV